jgi:phosphate transport system permease protein
MAVPLALATSIFLLDICPKFLRGPISFLTELLAAIPSVVYGLVGRVCAGADHSRPGRPDA